MAKYFAHKGLRSFRFRKELQGSEAWGSEQHQQHIQTLHKREGLETYATMEVPYYTISMTTKGKE